MFKSTQAKVLFIVAIIAIIVLGIYLWVNRESISSSADVGTDYPVVFGLKLSRDDLISNWTPNPSTAQGNYYTLLSDSNLTSTYLRTISPNTPSNSNSAIFGVSGVSYNLGRVGLLTVAVTAKGSPISSIATPTLRVYIKMNEHQTVRKEFQLTSGFNFYKYDFIIPANDIWNYDSLSSSSLLILEGLGDVSVSDVELSGWASRLPFFPETQMTRADAAILGAKVMGAQLTNCTVQPFTDVAITNFACPAITYLKNKGILLGMGDNTFQPNTTLTRAMAAALYARAAGISYDNPTPSFTDVPKTYPLYKEIEGAKRSGIMNGYGDGTFKPNDPVTRAVGAVVAYRATPSAPNEFYSKNTQVFSDVPTTYWAHHEIYWASFMHNYMRPLSTYSPIPSPISSVKTSPTTSPSPTPTAIH